MKTTIMTPNGFKMSSLYRHKFSASFRRFWKQKYNSSHVFHHGDDLLPLPLFWDDAVAASADQTPSV